MLTQEEIQEFKKITKEVYGRELTDEEAEEQGSRLVTLFELMIKYQKKKLSNQLSEKQI